MVNIIIIIKKIKRDFYFYIFNFIIWKQKIGGGSIYKIDYSLC